MASPSAAQRPAQPSQPTDKSAPTIWIKTSGPNPSMKAVNTRVQDKVITLEFTEGGKQANKLVMQVEDFNLKNASDLTFATGGWLKAMWGYPGNMSPERLCAITRVKGSHKLKVEARARSVVMNTEGKSRNFTNMKRSEVVSQILKENGYTPIEMDVEDTQITYPVIVQPGLTDAQFLQHLAGQEGFEFFDDTGCTGAHFRRSTYGIKPIRELRYFTAPLVGEILKYEIDSDVTKMPAQVTTSAIDPKTKQVVTAQGDNASTKRGGTGATVSRAIDATTRSLGAQKVTRLVSQAAQAKRIADRKFMKATRRSVKLKLFILGDPTIVSKSVIKVTGVGSEIDGLFYIQIVKHRIKNGEYRQELECRTDSGNSVAKERTKAQKATGVDDPGASRRIDAQNRTLYASNVGRATAKEAGTD